MFRLLLCIVLSVGFILPSSLFASEGYIGENPGLNFYSRIDSSAGQLVSGFLNKRISEYKTFAGFGKFCRKPMPWFDSTRMEQKILDEIWIWHYATLVSLAEKKRVSLTGDNLINLAECLRTTYAEMKKWAVEQYETHSTMGGMSLYMDGDTANSDYDIVADIIKINSLIFTEELPYGWTVNKWKASLSNLFAGKPVSPLISPKTQAEIDGIFGNSWGSLSGEISSTWDTILPPETLGELWIWEVCSEESVGGEVANMADEWFMQELAEALQWGGSSNVWWGSYNPRDTLNDAWDNASWSSKNQSPTSNADFFHTPRCEWIFCITFGSVNGSSKLLGGWKNISIETMLDTHIALLEPKSWQNSWLQKMSSNMLELPFTGLALKLSSMVKWWGVFISEKPGKKERVKTEETKELKDEKFEFALRCSLFSAWFSNSDLDMINSVKWAAFIKRAGATVENIQYSESPQNTVDPDSTKLEWCMNIYVENGRNTNYASFSDDLSEIKTFTEAMIKQVTEMLREGEKVDKLKTK
jgi:hypothetical protein